MSSPYVVHVACDFGQGKINTGIEFAHRPLQLSDLVTVVEELYSAELRLQTGNEHAAFHCAVVLLLVDVVSEGADRKGRWSEVTSIDQIANGAQLFVFDADSPPPSKGTIPKVQLVVTANQVMRFRNNVHSTVPPLIGSSAYGGGGTVSSSSQQANHSISPPMVHSVYTPSLNNNLNATPTTSSTLGRNAMRTFGSSGADAGFFTQQGESTSSLVTLEMREMLFDQLCQASGSHDGVSAQRLHAVLADYGLVLSTEQFTEMTDGERFITRQQWRHLMEQYTPVVDNLYVRLAAKAAFKSGEDTVQTLKDRVQTLQDEEHRLLIRHATLREEIAKATRDLREEEQRVKSLENNDRLKDWSMVQKFVSLKLRQNRLRKEEEQINKELSLL